MTPWILRGGAVLATAAALALGLPDPAPATPAPATIPAVPVTTPAATAAWFAHLPPSRAQRLVHTYPQALGNLDGAPLALRIQANALEDGPRFTGRQILGYQPGAHGRIIEAVGDLATAHRIAVLVPGSDTTLADFDDGLGHVQRRAPAWQARQLQHAAGPDTAVIAWLGYTTPHGIGRDAIRSELAQSGATALVRFLDGLTADRPGATITVIGHSYGTLVLGHAAARMPDAVTDLIAIGSPGMDVRHADDLHTRARLWAGSDPTDWTLHLPDLRILGSGHDTNPTEARFGALPLDVAGAQGHDGYFVPGTASLANMAAIAAGTDSLAHLATTAARVTVTS